MSRTHRPVYAPEKCLPCGTCSSRCPATVFTEQVLEPDSLRGMVARLRPELSPDPRPALPPCRAACPLGQDVPAYLTALARGEMDRAAEIIYRANPLPSVCGRLCLEACARACVRGGLDAPPAIRRLKRAAVEGASHRPTPAPAADRPERVAVVGAGPAGLSAAYQLRRLGVSVVVFDAAEEAGGLLRAAVPTFDLARRVLAEEIAAIAAMGVEFVFNTDLADLAAVQDLRADFAAVVLATGAGRSRLPDLPGLPADRGQTVLEFVRPYAQGAGPVIEGGLAVIGAGREAVAAARLALRAGADPVHLIMRRDRRESPADPRKLALAEQEGVQVLSEVQPVSFEDGQLCLAPVVFGPPDAVGRRWPQAVSPGGGAPRSDARLSVARLVFDCDRRSDLPGLPHDGRGVLALDERGGLRGLPGVFAAGEVLTGRRNAIEAMANGVRAAARVMRHLREAAS